MTRRRSASPGPTPGELGLPEHSALTVEGRIERAEMVGSHLVQTRRGRERRLRGSGWSTGLGMILLALVGVIAVTVVAFALS